MAGKIAEPLSQIDKITIIGGGQEGGVDAIVKANTYDAKVNRNVHVTGLSKGEAAAAEVLKTMTEETEK